MKGHFVTEPVPENERRAAQEGQRAVQTPNRVSASNDAPQSAGNGLLTWQDYLAAHPNGGGIFNQWMLDTIEALIVQVTELTRRLDEAEGE